MTILSTKKLQLNQRELLLNAGISFVDYDAIEIQPVTFTLSRKLKNIIITSQNGAKAIIKSVDLRLIENCFVVGEKTTLLLVENGLKVTKTAHNAEELAHFIAKEHKNESFTYFCGRQRRDELPDILKEEGIVCEEVVVYETHLSKHRFDRTFEGILFFSPSGVVSFTDANPDSTGGTTAFCIGETTATSARKYFKNVVISNATSIESTIAKTVTTLKKHNRY